jgi:hypothetical protein
MCDGPLKADMPVSPHQVVQGSNFVSAGNTVDGSLGLGEPFSPPRMINGQLKAVLPGSPHEMVAGNVEVGPLSLFRPASPQFSAVESLGPSGAVLPRPDAPPTVATKVSTLKVYRRQQSDCRRALAPSEDHHTDLIPDQGSDDAPIQSFVASNTKEVECLLPPPVPLRRQSARLMPPDFIPRRSCRLGKQKMFNTSGRQIQMDIMKRLKIVSDKQALGWETLEEYGRLFSSRPSDSHINALAALFGWTVPDDPAPDGDLPAISGFSPADLV